MAVDSNLRTTPAAIENAMAEANRFLPAPKPVKNRAYFKSVMEKATFSFYRSAKAVADVLLDARLTLSPEEFQQFIAEDCQFDASLVYKFIKMAADFRLNDPANELHLPEAWTLRYEIMMMKESTFRIGVTKGIINPECKLADLRKFREQLDGPKGNGKKAAAPQAPSNTETTPAETAVQAASNAETTTPSKEAAVKAPANNPGLQVGKRSTVAPATAPAKASGHGRIIIMLNPEIAEQHRENVERLKNSLEKLVKQFQFIGSVSVEIEVAA
jgi:hypothetical protein